MIGTVQACQGLLGLTVRLPPINRHAAQKGLDETGPSLFAPIRTRQKNEPMVGGPCAERQDLSIP